MTESEFAFNGTNYDNNSDGTDILISMSSTYTEPAGWAGTNNLLYTKQNVTNKLGYISPKITYSDMSEMRGKIGFKCVNPDGSWNGSVSTVVLYYSSGLSAAFTNPFIRIRATGSTTCVLEITSTVGTLYSDVFAPFLISTWYDLYWAIWQSDIDGQYYAKAKVLLHSDETEVASISATLIQADAPINKRWGILQSCADTLVQAHMDGLRFTIDTV